MNIKYKIFLIPLCVLFLTACTTMMPAEKAAQPGKTYLSWNQRQAQLASLDHWLIAGNIGIIYSNSSDVASFDWQKNKANYEINLHSPMNLKSARVVGDDVSVTLDLGKNQRSIAETPEKLLKKELGWKLPVTNLAYWIKGLPAPQTQKQTLLDKFNHLATLKQNDWSIRYMDFTSVNSIDLPSKIYLQNQNIKIKIIIKKWEIY